MSSRYSTCVAFVAVALVVAALPAHAQSLEQTSGPPGASLLGVVEHEGDILASGVGGGAFRRVGNTWTTQPLGLRLGSLIRVGETLFAFDGSSLYRSPDGMAWTPAWESNASFISGVSVAGDSLLVLANDSLFISGDGLAWRSLIRDRMIVDAGGEATGDSISFLTAAARTPDGTLWVGASGVTQFGMFRSSDGQRWEFVSPGPFSFTRLFYVSAAGDLYALISGVVYRYDAESEAWAPFDEGLGTTIIQAFVESTDVLFVQGYTSEGAVLFRLEGSAWVAVSLPVSSFTAVEPAEEGIFVVGEDRLFVGPGDGTWMALDEGLVASFAQPYTLGPVLLAVTRKGWARSIDDGATWEETSLPAVNAVYDFDGVAFGTGADDVYRSVDDGATWETVNAGINVGVFHNRRFQAMAAHDGVYYGGLYSSRAIKHQGGEVVGGVYRSTDGGSSWALFGSAFPINSNGARAGINRLAATDEYLIAATQEGLVRIAHAGNVWETISAPTDVNVLGLNAIEDRLFLATYQQVFVSADDGLTWTELAAGLPDGSFALTLHEAEGEAFVQLRPLPDPIHGLYRLDGDEWVDAGVSVPDWVQFNASAATDEYLFLGTSNHGVWRASLDAITVATEPDGLAGITPDLAPAFPNPTRDRATLRLALPEASDVRVEVFDVQGRLVAVLHDGRMEAGAGHVLELNAAGLAAGVYLVRASRGDTLLGRRVTVVR